MRWHAGPHDVQGVRSLAGTSGTFLILDDDSAVQNAEETRQKTHHRTIPHYRDREEGI